MATQKTTSKFWVDEVGNKIPINRINGVERMMEKESSKLLLEAKRIQKSLKEYKDLVRQTCERVYDAFCQHNNIDLKERKGNFVWYNFDRSIKIEVAVNESITFDDMLISAAREKLNKFINESIDARVEFVKELINEAFMTSRGRLDAKKVMNLLKYRSKIKHPDYQEAMDMVEASIRRPSSRVYFRIWERGADGKYENIDLNFSSI